jgi:exopolyphosphatase/guanosine-5'-triphosphate,3'-diphosphate pyrophosphatase
MVSGPPKRPIYAVVDVGSKSIRLLVARRLTPSAFEVVDEERFDARLGEGLIEGEICPDAFERGIGAMRIVAQIAAAYEPRSLVAVGTETLRTASNAGAFVARVHADTGISIRVISAQEEAFASYLGTINATRLADGVIMDIGGGSLEVMRVAGRHLSTVRSVPLGAIYSTERYFKSDPPQPREVRALRKAVRAQVEGISIPDEPTGVLWATGGAVRNVARLVRLRRNYPLRRLHGFSFSQTELKRVLKEMLRRPASERRKMAGLNSARAGTLPAAAVVLDELMSMLGVDEVRVSGQGLREGLVWELMRGQRALLPDVRAASIAGLAAANGVDSSGSEPEVRLAAEIFDATIPYHGFGHPELEVLVSATRLSEIGMHVDYYNRDRHAEYLIHSGDLHGFSHREIVLLAATVRHSSGGTAELEPYKSVLHDRDAELVATLAAVLGVTRAISRRPVSPEIHASVRLNEGELEILLQSQDRLDAELHALERPLRRLESALGASVSVSAQALPDRRLAELA